MISFNFLFAQCATEDIQVPLRWRLGDKRVTVLLDRSHLHNIILRLAFPELIGANSSNPSLLARLPLRQCFPVFLLPSVLCSMQRLVVTPLSNHTRNSDQLLLCFFFYERAGGWEAFEIDITAK